MTPFRITGRQFFLTYPQCPLTKEEALEQLEDKGALIAYVVAEEKHADGTPHLHAYLKFDRKKNFTGTHCFDLEEGTQKYHGNYQTVRNSEATINYCKKTENYIEKMEEEEKEIDLFDMARTRTREEFIKLCIQQKVSNAYCNQIWEMTRKESTIDENSAGQKVNNKVQSAETSNALDMILKLQQSMTTKTQQTQWTAQENQSSSSEDRVLEKQLGQSTTCPNLYCSLHTLTSSNSMKPLYTNHYCSTTYPSNTIQEKPKSTWWTENNQEPYIVDTQQLPYQVVW